MLPGDYRGAEMQEDLVLFPGEFVTDPPGPAPVVPTSAKEFCDRAGELVSGDRAQQHGDKVTSFREIAELWTPYIKQALAEKGHLDAADVAHLMVLFKITRTRHGNFNHDDWIDMVGYSACAGEIATKTRKGA